MNTVTKAQIVKIHATAKENGIDNVLLHDMIEQMTGKKSTRDLTKYEAMDLIDKLVGKEVKKKPVKGKASEAQIELIQSLVRELGWDDNPKRIRAFVKKYAHTEQLHWLESYQASNIIEALKKIMEKSQA